MNIRGCKFASGQINQDRRLDVLIYQDLPQIETLVTSDNPKKPPLAAKDVEFR
jgi:hypothetical protein